MKKYEKIKHAYDNYPKGTVFTWGGDTITSSGKFHFNDGYLVTKYNEEEFMVFDGNNWAEIVSKKRDKPMLISQDGVPLYDKDEYSVAYFEDEKGWYLGGCNLEFHEKCSSVNDQDTSKAFSTIEAAEKWIKEQNKPKSVCINLFNLGSSAQVSNDVIMLNIDGYRLGIKPSDLEDMLHAYKSL